MKPVKDKIEYLGWAASTMTILMYVSYISQIIANLQGNKGAWIQPAVTVVNCILWSIYGLKSNPKNIPIAAANIPGIFLAFITVVTCFI